MSASREKKNRQDLASQGIQDPKAIREAEEKAQQRKANRLYGAIAVVFVLVAALLVVVNSGVLERSATAITVDGENYTAAQMNYYYYGIKNSIINSGYSSFYGIDTSVAMDKQNMSDTAKMLLQVTDEGDITWDQFFRDYATRQLSVQVMAAKEAEANGMGEDGDIRAEVNEVIDNITAGAKEQGLHPEELPEAGLRQHHDRQHLQEDDDAGGSRHPLHAALSGGAELHRVPAGGVLSGQQQRLRRGLL